MPPDTQPHPAAAVDLLLTDLSGVTRGKRIPARELDHVLRSGVPLIGSLHALDIHGENVDEAGLALATGDGDRLLVPADGRVMPVPWAGEPLSCLLMTLTEPDGRPFFADPRHVLARTAARLAELELTPVVACELEFYLVDRERTPEGGPQPPRSPLTGRRDWSIQTYAIDELEAYGPCLSAVTQACALQGVATGSILAEYAPGQFEINLEHHPDVLRAADEAVLLKRAVRGVARRQGMDATFMAKPYGGHSGSGLHMHVSLLDRDGRNVLDDETTLRHAVGGLLATMAEATAIFAPNPNSFRRLQHGSYAPTVPTWGEDNRTVAVRTLGRGPSRRIEHRLAGADANPYLALAAVLAGLHHGLTHALEPPPPVTGNAYDARPAEGFPALPQRLPEALDAFEAGRILPDHIGGDYHRLYAAVRRGELRRFEALFDRREMDWYLAVI
jgi:glutamine synthetase